MEYATRTPPNKSLKIYQRYLELVNYSNDIVRKYPKCENFALVQEIKNSLYLGLRNLMYAVKSFNKKDKLQHLNELDINLSLLKVQIRLSYKYRYISLQNYQSWSTIITDICNMLGGWILSCQKR
ncbi:MAG: diversity-generating retroelement protein Avd [Clostridiales bacterium]|nr:diversity-generating retroelement protein Avd [Clostridiales bacterium]